MQKGELLLLKNVKEVRCILNFSIPLQQLLLCSGTLYTGFRSHAKMCPKLKHWIIIIVNLYILSDKLDDIKINFKVPQYLSCNKQRFPYWFGILDKRNQLLHQMIRSFRLRVHLESLEIKKNCDALFPNKNLYVNINQYNIGSSC